MEHRSTGREESRSERGPRRFGDYELLEEIGRGGMGIVYRARQVALGRHVALKVLPSFASMDQSAVQRFHREARSTARLQHPGIVPIYDFGEVNGVPFFAMELVDGPSVGELLTRCCDRPPSALRESFVVESRSKHESGLFSDAPGVSEAGNRYVRSCAALVAEVAGALTTAHEAGIVHRDLKPSNLLLHPNGHVVLVDFGLAHDETALELTRSGESVGTPAYMAPEQALGEDIDGRVDVYGLGAILYELLCLCPPFDATHAAQIMRMIVEDEPRSLRSLNPNVPKDLERIVLTCLAKEPRDRYQDVDAVASDLWAFLMGNELSVRSSGIGRRWSRVWRRHRRKLYGGAAAVVVASIAALGALVYFDGQTRERGEVALDEARTKLVQRDPDGARRAYERASTLLDDAAVVQDARLRHLREAFDSLYVEHRAELRDLVGELTEEQRIEVADLITRLEGRGTIRFRGLPSEARVAVKRFADGEFAEEWQPLVAQLPIGEYLVRVEKSGFAPSLQRVEVARDRVHELLPRLVPESAIEPGSSHVVDPSRPGGVLSVARVELTWAQYRRALAAMDPELRAEMLLKDCPDPQVMPAEHPARGMCFWQARAVAAHLNAHLLSVREYELVASAGFRQLVYPWGSVFDPSRVIADPRHRQAPEPVDSLPLGASVFGAQHLLGNVAEFLSPDRAGRVLLAGGHCQTLDVKRFRLDEPASLTVEVLDMEAQGIHAGLRLARFYPADTDPRIAAELATLLDRLERNHRGSLLRRWRIGGDGETDFSLHLIGKHRVARRQLRLPLVTHGFRQRGLTVRDGHGRQLATNVVRQRTSDGCDVRVDLAREAPLGQRYVLDVSTKLDPLSGLTMRGDRYEFRGSFEGARPFPVVHQVQLPRRCDLELVHPEPQFRTVDDGITTLTWAFAPDARAGRAFVPVSVRFRRDGTLTERWPARQATARLALDVLEALSDSDVPRLQRVLHPEFLERPSGRGKRACVAASVGDSSYGRPTVLDVTAVGDIVTVEMATDWTTLARNGDRMTVRRWPIQVQLLREPSQTRALVIRPLPRADTGTVSPDGYRHDALGVRLSLPGGSLMTRPSEQLTEMHVRLSPAQDPFVAFEVCGLLNRNEDDRRAVLVRLSAGAVDMRPGERLESEPGSPESEWQWLFGERGSGKWSREQWSVLQRGTRHFLVRRIAEGADRQSAMLRFRRYAEWFREAEKSLHID